MERRGGGGSEREMRGGRERGRQKKLEMTSRS